jgi:fatty-acyl-CoA synthase
MMRETAAEVGMRATMQDFPLTVRHLLWRAERLFPRKLLVTRTESGNTHTSFGEMAVRARKAAAAFTRLGVKRGDAIGVLAWSNARYVELYYAVPCMGAVLHTLNIRLFPDQLQHVIADGGDRVVCVDRSLLPVLEKLAGRMPSVEHVVVLGPGPLPESPLGTLLSYEELLAAERDDFTWPDVDEREGAVMCHTSGTTGMPKGVVYSHRSEVLHTIVGLQDGVVGFTERDTLLGVVPLFHANGWGLPYGTCMAGANFLLPDRWMGDAAALYELANAECATILAGVPTVWINLLRHLDATGGSLPTVEKVFCGGSAIPRALMEGMDRHGLRLVQGWGMTETSPIATTARPRSWHPAEKHLDVRIAQGAPIPCVELRIASLTTGEELPWDGAAFGEIQVKGPWVASGYHGGIDPDKTTPDGWFRTGDVATVDADGFVRIVDRTKDVIKSGGEWISSVELENALMGHPGVLEAAVIALPHARWQERPVAYVAVRGATPPTRTELLAFLKTKVASWWLPDEIRFVSEVPKTSVGKFDKKRLRAEAKPLAEA